MADAEGNNGNGTRRAWTDKEEEVLLACLKELVAQGQKTDNGFRPGYANKLELAMQKALPGTNLKAQPHMITIWKKNYASLVAILSRSGVGFNLNGDHKVDCDNEQWKEIIRLDSNAKTIRRHSWPLLEGWKEVFGKDRATGETAEDVMDAVNNLMHDHNIASHGQTTDDFVEVSMPDIQTETGDSVCQSSKGSHGSSHRKRKRNVDESMQSMCDLLGQIHRDTNARLESLASRIGVPDDTGIARKEVFELIKSIHGLSLKENFKICDKLIEKAERLEFFMGLPEENRHEYVMHMLNEGQ